MAISLKGVSNRGIRWLVVLLLLLFVVYSLTAPQNHSEAEDVYDFALKVERGGFAEQVGVNRVLALPFFGVAYKAAHALGYLGRAFPFMIFINRILAVLGVFLFWKICSGIEWGANGRESDVPLNAPSSILRSPRFILCSLPAVLCFAFSYGFWRYANEAETYILACVVVLGAWCLVIKQSTLRAPEAEADVPLEKRIGLSVAVCRFGAVLLSAVGILVHLLNLIPLLLIIPLYYLLSRKWKLAVFHGVATGVLVLAGYAICAPWIDLSELGANHHGDEAGLSVNNLFRGAVAFGQCVVSGNFLFGFGGFREFLVRMFPSRMLAEEFYMAEHMPVWIPWCGVATLGALGAVLLFLCVGVLGHRRQRGAISSDNGNPLHKASNHLEFNAFTTSMLIWFILYSVAVVLTEAGSPELWILGLIPFWLIVASFLHGAWGRELLPASNRSSSLLFWGIACLLFTHNLVAGLLPLMTKDGDYHAAKGRWLVEHALPSDLILTDYEPVMIFYLRYHTRASVLNSGEYNVQEIKQKLDSVDGHAYALNSFLHPMDAMRMRYPKLYARMESNGQSLRPEFRKSFEDEFGGVYEWEREMLNE